MHLQGFRHSALMCPNIDCLTLPTAQGFQSLTLMPTPRDTFGKNIYEFSKYVDFSNM
jgi:hypothetical protein